MRVQGSRFKVQGSRFKGRKGTDYGTDKVKGLRMRVRVEG
jgi:hypothetical protein